MNRMGDKYDYGYTEASGAHGAGTYEGKAVSMMIDVLEVRDGFELRRATNLNDNSVKYRLFWDGECISTVHTEKEARALLNDFAPPKRTRKAKIA